MRTISLWQPWASLWAGGYKTIETRSWPIHYRGRIAIHAAQARTRQLVDLCERGPFAECLKKMYPKQDENMWLFDSLPRGAIVGTVAIVDCLPAENIRALISDTERAFGDYADGRWAFLSEDPELLTKPFSTRGRQGWFEVPTAYFNP